MSQHDADVYEDVLPRIYDTSLTDENLASVSDSGICASWPRLLALAFTIGTVVINVCDVASDIVVAVEFYEKDRMLWFWLVMSSLIVGSVVYAIFGVMVGTEHSGVFSCVRKWPKFIVFWMLLPIAQFFPVLHLVHESKRQKYRYRDGTLRSAAENLRIRAKTAGRASRPALLHAAVDIETQGKLQDAFHDHFETYFPFYIESAVEALPQAAIQIVAVTYFNEATPAQVVSICLSLLSVLSKLVAILRSFDVRLTVFRVLCGVHDVFGACYILASVLAPSSGRHETFLGTAMTTLSLVWCWKMVALVALHIVALVVVPVVRWTESSTSTQRRDVLLLLFIVVIATGPALLTLECLKLSIFGWYALSKGPRGPSPPYRLAVDFIIGDVESGGGNATIDAQGQQRRLAALRGIRSRSTRDDGSFGTPPGYFCNRRADRQCSMALAVVQLISFAYPFINVGLYGGEQSVLQWIFFVGAVVTLVPAVALFPYAWRRYLVMELLHSRELGIDLSEIARAMSNYFASTDVALLLAKTVPSAVLPVEVLRYVVSGYLHSEDVDTSGLSCAELDAINHVEEGSGW